MKVWKGFPKDCDSDSTYFEGFRLRDFVQV